LFIGLQKGLLVVKLRFQPRMKRFRPYFHYLRPVKLKLIIGVLAGVIAGAAMSAGLPLMMDKVFPVIFKSEETGRAKEIPDWLEWIAGDNVLLVACLMLPVVFVISGVCGYVSKILLHYCGMRVLEGLRVDVFRRLQKLSLKFHGEQQGGDLLSRVMGDTERLQQVLSKMILNTIILPGALVGSIGVLIYLSVKDSSVMFMLFAMITVPLCVFPIRIFVKRLAKKASLMMGKQGDISATVSENLASQPVVRAYMMEENQVAKMEEDTGQFLEFNMGVQRYRYLVSPTVEIISAIGI